MSSNKSSSSSKSSGDFPITITTRDVGIDQTIGKLTRFADVIKTLDAQFKASLSSMTAYNQIFANFGRNFNTLNQGFNAGVQGAQRFNQAIQQNVNTLRAGQTTLTQYMNTQRQSTQANQQASASQATLTQTNQRYNQTLQQTVSANQTAANSQNSLNQARMRTMTTMRDLTNQINRYNAGNQNTVQSTNEVTAATDNASTGYNRIGEAIGGAFQKGMNLFLSFTMLKMAMQESVGMQEMLASQQEKVNELTVAADEAIRMYGEGSKEATRAEKQRDDALRGLSYTQRNANMAAGDASFFIIMMATNILGSLIPALTKWKETSESVRKGWDTLIGALDGLKAKILAKAAATTADTAAETANTTATNAGFAARVRSTAATVASSVAHRTAALSAGAHTLSLTTLTAMTNTVTGAFVRFFAVLAGGALGAATAMVNVLTAAMGRLRIAMIANMAVLGPIGIAIVAIGLALGAVATDFMGVRTALEGFGLAVGQAVPILYPFLEGIQGIGAALGLTGESADEAQKHFENASNGFKDMATLWNDTVANMQDSNNTLISSMGDLAATLGRDIADASNKLDTQLKATTDTWNKFVDALGSGDYKTATDIIISTFESLPGIIGTALSTIGTIVYNAFAGLVNIVGPALKGIGTELATRLLNGIAESWHSLSTWVTTNFVMPVKNTIMTLPSKITGIANEIVSKLLSGEYLGTIQKWAGGIWDEIVNFFSGKTGGEGLDTSSKTGLSSYEDQNNNGIADIQEQTTNAVKSGTATLGTPKDLSKLDTSKITLPPPPDQTKQGPVSPTSSPDVGIQNTTPAPTPNIITPSNTGLGQGAQGQGQATILPYIEGTAKISASGKTPDQIAGGQGAKGQSQQLDPEAQAISTVIAGYDMALKDATGGTEDATYAAKEFVTSLKDIPPELVKNTGALSAIGMTVGDYTAKNDSLQASLNSTALALQYNYLQGELQRKGQLEQKQALQDMQTQIEVNKGSLQEYASQVEEETILGYAFTLGQQEQRKALLDSKVEVANTTGILQEYALQLESGEAQSVAFAQGQQEIVKQFHDTIVETANLQGQFKLLEVAMNSTGAAQIMFNNGFEKGRVETAQQIIAMDALQGEYVGTREVLLDAADGMGLATQATKLSNEQLAQFIGVLKGAPDAVFAFTEALGEFGRGVIDNVAEAMKKGKDEVKDAIEEIEEILGDNLTKPEQKVITVIAETQNAVEAIQNDLSLAFTMMENKQIILDSRNLDAEGLKEAISERITEGIQKAQEAMEGSGGGLKTAWQNIITEMKTIADDPLNATQFIESATKISASLATMGYNGQAAMEFLTGMGVPAETAATALANAGYSMDELGNAAAAADPELQKMITSIERLNTIDSAATQIFTVNIPGYVVTMAAAVVAGFLAAEVGAIQELNTIDSTATQVFVTNIPSYPVNVSNAVAEHFGKAADDGISLMEALDTGVSQSFENMAEYPALVSEAVDQEFGKAADDGTNLIQALERAVEQSANAMADSLGKVADAIDAIGESAQNAESDVESLRNAVESLPNIEREIVYTIKTVGSKPKGAQFGTNMMVDKPQMLLVGEGWGKERVKVSPGTMPFAEDFRREMDQKFAVQSAAQTPQQQQGDPNIYAPGYQHTNQTNNPDLGGSSGTGVMISNNASLIQMNNANGKRMTVDGKTGTVIMINGSNIASDSNSNSNSGGGSSSGNVNEGTGNHYTDENGNNYNYDNDSNSQNNVYASGYGSNTTPPPSSSSNTTTSPPASSGNSNGVNQSQTNNQSGSGGNYYYQAQTNNRITRVNTNMGSMPQVSPGLINQSSSSGGSMPVSGSYSTDSRSRLLSRGDPFGFQTRVVHETPVEVTIDLEGVRIAKKILKILTEEMGFGSGYYG